MTWLATSLLMLLKERSERMLGSTRDLLYIFLLFVAFKVDDPMSFTWKVVFLIPWMWFSALALLAVMVSGPQQQATAVTTVLLARGRLPSRSMLHGDAAGAGRTRCWILPRKNQAM